MKIVFAQLNLAVGDISNNTKVIINAINRADSEYDADIIIFPELSICSYPPEDLLHRPSFLNEVNNALKEIISSTGEIFVLLGHPQLEENELYNSCSVIKDKKVISRYNKQILPNYSVFDEKRYFVPGNASCLFNIGNTRAAITICEDIWESGPAKQAAEEGAKIIFNLNASPYHVNKLKKRESIIKKRAQENSMPIAYINLIGGQDELVFDGNSMLVDQNGSVVFHAPQFEEGIFQYTFAIGEKSVPINSIECSEEENIYQALCLGVRDYVYKNNFNGVVIGLSGGIDSALTTTIAVDALGAENVEVLIMPSRYTAKMSVDDAFEQANLLGIKSEKISIEPAFSTMLNSLAPRFDGLPEDITEENIQARCRGVLLMALSNKTGKLLLTTGNKSEVAVGYSTLYGDMCGGFSPLKDVWKTMVYKLALWRNRKDIVIPENVINRPPSAELKENQVDQDSLPDYETLDAILEQYIEQDLSPSEIIANGFAEQTVSRIARLVDRNEYKRRQAAPGVRITQRAFGRDRRYPITSGYQEN
ncbi:MAG: NAD+ synthase [Pseudomonadota bacterium]